MNFMNGSDMLTVQNANYDWVFEVEDAETLLRCCWERFFSSAHVGPINEGDALEVGTLLRVCCDRIFAAVLSYRLAAGEDGPGVAGYFETAADYREARELQELNSDAIKRERELSGPAAAALTARRMEALRMPAAEGVKALRGLLGK